MRIVSENEVRAWMIANIAERTTRDPGTVDLELPIAAFGLDSLSLLELLGELDEWLEPYREMWNSSLDKLEDHLSADPRPRPRKKPR